MLWRSWCQTWYICMFKSYCYIFALFCFFPSWRPLVLTTADQLDFSGSADFGCMVLSKWHILNHFHHLCKENLYSSSVQWLLLSLHGRNLLLFLSSMPHYLAELLLPPHSLVLWSLCHSLLWNPLILPTSVHFCSHSVQLLFNLKTELQPFPSCQRRAFNKLPHSFCRFLISPCSCHSYLL